MLQHFVFLKYQPNTKVEHIQHFKNKMLALKASIGELVEIEVGLDELHDARSWDVVLVMQFQTVDDLRAYQKHPEHQSVMKFNDPFVADIASVDFNK